LSGNLVEDWFKDRYGVLHPMLQRLHRTGGVLRGDVDIVLGSGLAGFLGRRLAAKLGVPKAGRHELAVQISHHPDGLHWDRCFDNTLWMRSVFTPVGTIDGGYWVEQTGPLKMRLTVDIKDGGWSWRCLGVRFFGLPLPPWVFPKSRAWKTVEDGRYRFHVGFSVPVVGDLLSYSGLLDAE
jgi:hypothetical protein